MILIRGGLLIDPASNVEAAHDVLVDGNVIKGVEKPGSVKESKGVEVIEAKGKWVVPGLIDLHVHLREPGYEWKETIASGSRAAVLGGFTSVCCMPNTNPVNDCAEVTAYIRDKAQKARCANVLPIGSISIALKGKELSPLSELWRAGCVAFSDDGEPVYDAGLMRRALEWSLMLGVPLTCHEEEKALSCGGCMNESAFSTKLGLSGIHTVCEDVMVARDIELSRVTGARVHFCHVSSARSVELIRRAKNDGIKVSAEVTPHHLALDESRVGNYDTNAKMNPPLREAHDMEGLLQGLSDGTLDAVASDHAPHERASKEVEFSTAAFGILGLQTSLPLLLSFVRGGKLSRMRAIEALTSAPARAFGLPSGRLATGAPADITIIDPLHSWRFSKDAIQSLSFNSPFLDWEFQGCADTVLVSGRVVVEERKLKEGSSD